MAPKDVIALALVAKEPSFTGTRSAADIRTGAGYTNHGAYRASIAELSPDQIVALADDPETVTNIASTLSAGSAASTQLKSKLQSMVVKTDGGVVSRANIESVKKILNTASPTEKAEIVNKIKTAYTTIESFKNAFVAEYGIMSVDAVFA